MYYVNLGFFRYEFIISILTSSAVAGLFAVIFKESFKAKLKAIEKEIDTVRAFQAKDYDESIQSVRKIWSELSKIDDYVRHGLAHDINQGKLSNLPLRPFILEINKEMALLLEELYEETEKCLDEMSEQWLLNIKRIGEAANRGKEGSKTEAECIEEVNDNLKNLREAYKDRLSPLRLAYRNYIVKHLQNT
jgi:hypothetical protein